MTNGCLLPNSEIARKCSMAERELDQKKGGYERILEIVSKWKKIELRSKSDMNAK